MGWNFAGPGSAPGGGISGVIGQLQSAQNAANAANQQRYNVGLNTIKGNVNSAKNFTAQGQGYIQSAINNTGALGQSELQQNELNRQQGIGSATQSAYGRGLGNTTILNSLQSGVNRNANMQATNINEQTQQQKNSLLQAAANQSNQQANTTLTGGNDVSQFISARNDLQPDISQYIPLIQGAAAAQKQRPMGAQPVLFNPYGSGFGNGSMSEQDLFGSGAN